MFVRKGSHVTDQTVTAANLQRVLPPLLDADSYRANVQTHLIARTSQNLLDHVVRIQVVVTPYTTSRCQRESHRIVVDLGKHYPTPDRSGRFSRPAVTRESTLFGHHSTPSEDESVGSLCVSPMRQLIGRQPLRLSSVRLEVYQTVNRSEERNVTNYLTINLSLIHI